MNETEKNFEQSPTETEELQILKTALNEAVSSFGTNSPLVLELSQKIDILILAELKKQHCWMLEASNKR